MRRVYYVSGWSFILFESLLTKFNLVVLIETSRSSFLLDQVSGGAQVLPIPTHCTYSHMLTLVLRALFNSARCLRSDVC
jgi:hypothetical protein